VIPEGSPKPTDLVDIIMSASSKQVAVIGKDGTKETQLVLDEDALWFKTGSIASNTFGRMAYVLKEWERKRKKQKGKCQYGNNIF